MERNSSGNNLKYHSNISGRPFRSETNEINKKFKDSWDLTSSSSTTTETNIDGGDLMGLGFPWPPRSYTCSFCKREFKSAQALGGHMNVHRRDRARLRQFSPPPPVDQSDQPSFLNLNLDVNPKPKSSKLTQLSHKLPLPSLVSPPETPSSAAAPSPHPSIEIKKTVKTLFRVEEFMGSKCEKGEIGGLDLEMGLLRESKEELDLELRLGCS